MSNKLEDNNSNNLRRRRCFYDFSKDYPGTRYDKNKRSSTTDELDGKRAIIRNVLAALAIILSFALAYLVVYTAIGISREEVAGLDEIGATAAEETYTASDEDIINMIKERSAQSQQSEETTDDTVSSEETLENSSEITQ